MRSQTVRGALCARAPRGRGASRRRSGAILCCLAVGLASALSASLGGAEPERRALEGGSPGLSLAQLAPLDPRIEIEIGLRPVAGSGGLRTLATSLLFQSRERPSGVAAAALAASDRASAPTALPGGDLASRVSELVLDPGAPSEAVDLGCSGFRPFTEARESCELGQTAARDGGRYPFQRSR